MALAPRQPFAALDVPRMQSLSNVKNRQNAITASFSSPLKNTQSIGKRSASAFDEDEDSENLDPAVFNSPTKRSKTTDAPSKPHFNFRLLATPQSPAKPNLVISSSPCLPSVRKALTSTPNTAASTPNITTSRGSPKHKRIGLLSKRRPSSSPFKRIDPPSFARNNSPALPFSIDAALSGTIPSYTPKPVPVAPAPISELEESMPKSWFFDIHEDTPEQEATNLMEHSACVLDISSDDDSETRRRNEEMERGKENIPPPGHFPPTRTFSDAQTTEASLSDGITHEVASEPPTKLPRLRNIAQDAMDEDRRPLSDLPAAEFYGPGLDATSYVTVDAAIEKPSGLSKEFDFNVPAAPEAEEAEEEKEEFIKAAEPIGVFVDEISGPEIPTIVVVEANDGMKEVLAVVEPVAS